ncbi:unannotated protein [freshwater metagenome]|uniref:Unannotated protein n=1 Tax=freshwater metagenome TaxID=449393 RepID=A0A6J7D0P4_9ZZZZ
MGTQLVEAESIDFAVAVWREEGIWMAAALPVRGAITAEALTSALRQFPGEGGVYGLVAVSDEFFAAVHQIGDRTRAFISDSTAILDWSLADELAEMIGLQVEEDELEDFEAIGDLSIFADFGLDATEVSMLCADDEMYPDEQVKVIAKRVGFAAQLASVLPAN